VPRPRIDTLFLANVIQLPVLAQPPKFLLQGGGRGLRPSATKPLEWGCALRVTLIGEVLRTKYVAFALSRRSPVAAQLLDGRPHRSGVGVEEGRPAPESFSCLPQRREVSEGGAASPCSPEMIGQPNQRVGREPHRVERFGRLRQRLDQRQNIRLGFGALRVEAGEERFRFHNGPSA
jgi:hypothetical protein